MWKELLCGFLWVAGWVLWVVLRLDRYDREMTR